MMRRALVAIGMLAGAVLAACSPAPTPRAKDANTNAMPAPREATPDTTPPTAPALPEPPARLPLVAVDGEGLRLVDPDTGATRPIPFGMPEAELEAILQRAFGRVADARGESADCGSQRFARWNRALSTWSGDAGFSGWSLDQGSALSSMSGVRLGSSRSELSSALTVEVSQSSLGTEFTAGGMGGLLASNAPNARVTHLWAGDTCIMR